MLCVHLRYSSRDTQYLRVVYEKIFHIHFENVMGKTPVPNQACVASGCCARQENLDE